MRYAILGLAVGIAALAVAGGVGGRRTVQAQEPDFSGIGEIGDFSAIDEIANMAPPAAEEPVAEEPPTAALEEPAPAVAGAALAPVEPVAAGGDVVALPATGDGGEDSAALAARLLLYAAGLAVMGTLIVAAAKRRA